MKYVVAQDTDGFKMAIVFSETINHKDAAESNKVAPVSAGFFTVRGGEVKIDFSRPSSSLGIGPKPDDAREIETALMLGGVL